MNKDFESDYYMGASHEYEGAGNEYEGAGNEFIVGGDEIYDTPFIGDMSSNYLGGFVGGGAVNCFLIFIIIVIIYMIYVKMKKSRHHIMHGVCSCGCGPDCNCSPNCRCGCNSRKHGDTFDNLLIPPTYFDYSQHGTQYINWY